MEVVENQLRDCIPLETSMTLERLIETGHTKDQAMELIACVVCAEIFDVVRRNKPYDESRYVAGLRRLPRLPWEGKVGSDAPNASNASLK